MSNQALEYPRYFCGKEDPTMKKYVAPEMKALAFVAEESVAAPLDGSKLFNDGELEW